MAIWQTLDAWHQSRLWALCFGTSVAICRMLSTISTSNTSVEALAYAAAISASMITRAWTMRSLPVALST